jgi:DNA (cytosine-5)-methyltransferase 1
MSTIKKTIDTNRPKIVSLFSGAGGLDLGFEKAGFQTVWANEYDKTISPTYQKNFPHVEFDGRSISNISDEEIKLLKKKHEILGVIGGPPCQSWSEAGAKRGINDPRGKLFHDYIRFIKIIKPAFFVAENVHGLIHSRNKESFDSIKEMFSKEGYLVEAKLLNASDFDVPQDRQRVFIIGYKKTYKIPVTFPLPLKGKKKNLRDAIWYLAEIPVGSTKVLNHDLTPDQTFSSIYMSRNRVRSWDEQSFTILAMDRHVPIHPSAPKMKKIGKDKMTFIKGYIYRRFTIRECAEIQTFPKKFNFIYSNVRHGYKMIGNAVPVKMAYHVAKNILNDLLKSTRSLK